MQNVSFKGHMPVLFYAKHPRTQEFVPIGKEENIKKCQSFIVKSLNGTVAKAKRDPEFITSYKIMDRDYRMNPVVCSKFDPATKKVHLITGRSVDDYKNLGLDLGKAKKEIIGETGDPYCYEALEAGVQYRDQVRVFLRNNSIRVKDENGQNVLMKVYFEPVYGKNGLKDFKYDHVRFCVDA